MIPVATIGKFRAGLAFLISWDSEASKTFTMAIPASNLDDAGSFTGPYAFQGFPQLRTQRRWICFAHIPAVIGGSVGRFLFSQRGEVLAPFQMFKDLFGLVRGTHHDDAEPYLRGARPLAPRSATYKTDTNESQQHGWPLCEKSSLDG